MRNLSTGQRINQAGDDASGLAVSEKLRSQIRGLRQAERNTEDGISFIATAEGYLNQSSEIVQRIRTLAVQTANGIYTPEDRQLVQVEVSALVDELDRVASQAEFNKFKLFEGDFARGSKKASMWPCCRLAIFLPWGHRILSKPSNGYSLSMCYQSITTPSRPLFKMWRHGPNESIKKRKLSPLF